MMGICFCCWFGDEDVQALLDCVQCDGEMCGIWSKDGDSITRRESVNCFDIGLGINGGCTRIGRKRNVEVVVYKGYVLVKMLTLSNVAHDQ